VLNLPQVQAVRQEQSGRRVSSQGATRVALYGAPAKALNPAQARVAQLDAYAKQNLSGPVKIGGHGAVMGNVTWLRIEIGGKEYRLTPQHVDQATLNQLAQMKTKDANIAGNRNVIKRFVADMLLPPTAKALKMRYNRGSLDDTMRVAKATSAGKVLYVFATACGFTISKTPPPFTQRHYVVRDGKVSEAGGIPGR